MFDGGDILKNNLATDSNVIPDSNIPNILLKGIFQMGNFVKGMFSQGKGYFIGKH